MTVAKTGAEHIASLRDGRAVYIDGQRVNDVTAHPAFKNAVRSAGALYDFQAQPENIELMTFMPDGSNRRVNRALADAAKLRGDGAAAQGAAGMGAPVLRLSSGVRPTTSPPRWSASA